MDFEKDYYAVLGLENTASNDDIKRAYRILVKKYHPDVNTNRNASDIFNAISEAYEVLSDPKTREEYDAVTLPGHHDAEREERAREIRYAERSTRKAKMDFRMPTVDRTGRVFLLSLIVPGLAHFEVGERKTGALLFIGYFTFWALALAYGVEIGALALIVWAFAAFDAYLLLKKKRGFVDAIQ